MPPLAKRMIRELELQRKSRKTTKAYVTAVAQLAAHYGRSPVDISLEEVRDYLHWLIVQRKLASSSCNQKLAGIRFLYRAVLGQPFDVRVPMKRSGRLPQPLSRREVAWLLAEGASRWVAGGRQFLFSVRALSKVYRAKYLDGLRALWQRGQLDLRLDLSSLDERGWARWTGRLRKHSWVVYAKRPFAGPEKLLDYLSRYTHRVAISNHRIQSCAGGQVQFSYRDRQDGDRRKLETLLADEFISRFLRHVLPDRFTRVRHYGFLAGRNKRQALARIRASCWARTRLSTNRHRRHNSGFKMFWASTPADVLAVARSSARPPP